MTFLILETRDGVFELSDKARRLIAAHDQEIAQVAQSGWSYLWRHAMLAQSVQAG